MMMMMMIKYMQVVLVITLSEISLSILPLIWSLPGALLLGNLCIILLISSGVTGLQNILFLQGNGQYFLKSDCPHGFSDYQLWTNRTKVII